VFSYVALQAVISAQTGIESYGAMGRSLPWFTGFLPAQE